MLRSSALLLASLLTIVSGCSDDSKKEVKPLPSTDDLYAYNVAVLERAIAIVGEDRALGEYNLGRVHQRFGRDKSGIPHFERALEIDPAYTPALRALGNFYEVTSQGEKALRAYQLTLRHDPLAAGVWTQLGLVLLHMDPNPRPLDAIEALETEIRAGTHSADTYYLLGLARKSLTPRDWEGAIAAFRKSLEIDPGKREALHSMSEALRMTKQFEEAKVYLEKFRKLKDAQFDAAMRATGSQTNEADQKNNTAQAWYDAAGLFISEHNEIVAQAAAERPLDDETTKRATQFIERCRDALEKALEFDPKLDAAHELKIDLASKSGVPGDLLAARRSAYAARPERLDWATLLAMQLLRESALDATRRPSPFFVEYTAEARKVLEKTLLLEPRHAFASRLLAELYLRRTSTVPELQARALQLAKIAVEHQTFPDANNYDTLAFAYDRNRQPNEALQALREGIEKVPAAQKAQLERRLQQFVDRARQDQK